MVLGARTETVVVLVDATVLDLKRLIEEKFGMPVAAQQIVFLDVARADSLSLFNCGVRVGTTVHVRPTAPPASAGAPAVEPSPFDLGVQLGPCHHLSIFLSHIWKTSFYFF